LHDLVVGAAVAVTVTVAVTVVVTVAVAVGCSWMMIEPFDGGIRILPAVPPNSVTLVLAVVKLKLILPISLGMKVTLAKGTSWLFDVYPVAGEARMEMWVTAVIWSLVGLFCSIVF
jgi:hypothetical protein